MTVGGSDQHGQGRRVNDSELCGLVGDHRARGMHTDSGDATQMRRVKALGMLGDHGLTVQAVGGAHAVCTGLVWRFDFVDVSGVSTVLK